jgi:hypothetical protein
MLAFCCYILVVWLLLHQQYLSAWLMAEHSQVKVDAG